MAGSKMEGSSAPAVRRDPHEVLCVTRDSSDQEIKSAYRKLALKYHPDKNANNPEASERFKEVAYSYGILSDPEKRWQYDMAGFGALDAEGTDMEIDLSNLGTVNTMFAALFSKLGVPIKTTVSANVLEEALNGTVTIRPLPIGTSLSGKVEKQSAHFFGVTISNEQAEAGVVVRVTSAAQSKFKLLYFEQDANGGYGLALQVPLIDETLTIAVDFHREWIEKNNRFIWRWKKGDTLEMIAMTVRKDVLYEDFVNSIINYDSLNCEPKDLVISYMHSSFENQKVLPFKMSDQLRLRAYLNDAARPISRVYVVEKLIQNEKGEVYGVNNNISHDSEDEEDAPDQTMPPSHDSEFYNSVEPV